MWVLEEELLAAPAVSSTNSIPSGFLQSEVVGIYLPGTGTLGWGPGVGLGLLTPEIPLQNFYPLHVSEGPAYSTSLLLLPVWWVWFL